MFTVVIPVYNKQPHLERSIGSALRQTFQNFELILIDDASTDRSFVEAERLADERTRILKRDEPGPGGYAARNLGVEHARGEWVAFLDADDEWHPEHLEELASLRTEVPDAHPAWSYSLHVPKKGEVKFIIQRSIICLKEYIFNGELY